MGKSIKILLLFLFLVLASSNHPFTVINRCSEVFWAGTYGENDTPLGGSSWLNPNEHRCFTTIRDWTAGRIVVKSGCDSTGVLVRRQRKLNIVVWRVRRLKRNVDLRIIPKFLRYNALMLTHGLMTMITVIGFVGVVQFLDMKLHFVDK